MNNIFGDVDWETGTTTPTKGLTAWLDEEAAKTRQHSRLAPSALKRILACPKSVVLSEALPKRNRSSVYAAEGSVAHMVAEAYLIGERLPAELEIGSTVEHEGHRVTIDGDMHKHGRVYEWYVRGLMHKGDILYVEQTVRLDAIVGEDADMYGHLDAAIWSPSRKLLIVVDYKYGRGIQVDAYQNPQLKAYALGAMFTLPDVDPDEVRNIEIHVLQPRVPGGNQPDTISRKDLIKWGYEKLTPVVRDIIDNDAAGASFVTGDHCRFCPALSQCPAMRERAVKAARKAFEDKPIPASALTDDELAVVLDEIDVVEAYFEAARDEGLARALAESEIRGRMVVDKKGKRVFVDEKKAVAALENEFGLRAPDVYAAPAIKSVAQIEKLVPKDRLEAFKELWTTKSSGKVLVKTSDKRIPVRVRPASEVFKDVPIPKEQ